jgi:hypothetical protein
MRLPPVLLMSLTLTACVSFGGRQQAQPLPPANVGDTRAAAVAPAPPIAPHPPMRNISSTTGPADTSCPMAPRAPRRREMDRAVSDCRTGPMSLRTGQVA